MSDFEEIILGGAPPGMVPVYDVADDSAEQVPAAEIIPAVIIEETEVAPANLAGQEPQVKS